MAVAPSPNSKASVSAPTKEKKRKMLGSSVEEENGTKVDNSSSQPKKRNSNPGVRVIGGRVYDSENGTTCHQCRQKTYAVFASCKNKSKTKPCPLKYCNTCLLNRYGEKVEDVALMDEWSCPKCRDACNCSICRKKRGHEPTGMLAVMAKAGGFSSVSNMLDVKGAENVSNYKRVKETCTSPRKKETLGEGVMVTSPKTKGKENLFDGKIDANADPALPITSAVKEKPKKSNQKKPKPEGSKEVVLENGNSDAIKPKKKKQNKLSPEGSIEIVLEIGNSDAIKPKKMNQKRLKPEESKEMIVENGNSDAIKPKKITQKKMKLEKSKETIVENENTDAVKSKEMTVENGNKDAMKPKKIKQKKLKVEGSNEMIVENGNIDAIKPKKITQKKLKLEKSNGENAILKVDGVQKKQKGIKKSTEEKKIVNENGEVLDVTCDQNTDQSKVDKNTLNLTKPFVDPIIPLPTGSELVNVAGVDLPKEDVGNALQFLEFCSTFGKVLDVKKGQAEAVLRDLIKVRSTRRGKCSVAIQFHIQLLSVIQSESESESESPVSKLTHANDSWLKGLKSCIPKSYLSEKKIDSLDKKSGGYDTLDSSTKLRVLTFLCDEVLGTEKIRNWMDEQNGKFVEKRKEARSKLSDAREKEKSLKQKMQDDIAKAIIKREGAPLTLMEHDEIVSKIKKEAAEAHAEMLACKQLVPIDNERPDAVRIEPTFRGNDGHFFWRLKGCSDKSGILLQDIGDGDLSVETVDKWIKYDDEQMDLVEKHINSLRLRIVKGYKNYAMKLV
ncbi:unnamed protein product [Lactuca virosa]|uniref:DDT domain-containing protein n=1 Tax=Lactuca virosa TaxID=75947 RepID=A0AAU9M0M9_9ASTR|nr:unnamed protein product [Lactuca virosa]